jgi:hypothetical protein
MACIARGWAFRAFQLIETACWAAKPSQGVPMGRQPATGGAKLRVHVDKKNETIYNVRSTQVYFSL